MTTSDYIDILGQGVVAWNEWRKKRGGVIPLLQSADLSSRNLTKADFHETILTGGNLSNAVLIGADFNAADLGGALLKRAELSGANLRVASLNRADLSGARLMSAVLVGTGLVDADFSGVLMAETVIVDTDLSKAKNLELVIHNGPSYVDINTIYKSGGNIPDSFLRGCGVPEDFIVQIPALAAAMNPIQFYSCFISYSSKDEEFAKRLYNDLQREGVRCWFAPEHLKIGDRFRVRIDESIRLYDKLVLVLSENSVSSEWVGDEVEAALEKEEGQGGKIVLFPLRIDNAVKEINSDWPAKIRRRRHIGDFRDWKNHDSYKKAFEGLMRDLKAGEKR